MPLGKGVRYRMKDGIRLAFKGPNVIEAKNMKSGAIHTPEEFRMDRKKTKIMSKGTFSSPSGDIGEKRGMEATKAIKAFKGDGKVMKAASYFGSAKPNASKAGNSPS